MARLYILTSLDTLSRRGLRFAHNSIFFLSFIYYSYTPVCTTELGEAAILDFEFKNRGVKIVGFSCSPKEHHKGWIADIRYVSGAELTFPIFSDPTREHAAKLGILDKNNLDRKGVPLTARVVYILNPNKTIELFMAYPANTGRKMDEILRAIDSILLTSKHKVATPCNWQPGDDVIVDYSLTDAMANMTFGKDKYRTLDVPSEKATHKSENKRLDEKHYLRYAKDPSKYEYETPF